jgi:hypothetical protein
MERQDCSRPDQKETEMTKLHLLTLALVASLSLPTLAQAGGFGEIFTPEPRVESPTVDIGSVFHNTDNGGNVSADLGDVFHNTDGGVTGHDLNLDMDGKYHDLGIDFGGAAGNAGQPGKGGSTKVAVGTGPIALNLDCAVAGTPAEFPDDLRITNAGSTTIPVGTQIKWRIKSPRLSGAAVLSAPLKAGKTVRIDGVLAGGLEAGTPCSVKIIGL